MEKKQSYVKNSTLRDLLYVLFRRKWVIIGVLLATAIPVTLHTLRIPTVYQATAKLLVKPGRENIYVAPVGDPGGQSPPTIVQRVSELIKTELQILLSQTVIRRTVEDIKIANLFPQRVPADSTTAHAAESISLENAVSRAMGSVSARRVGDTDIIEVGFTSHDPEIAAKFVNTHVDRFLERHLEVHRTAQGYDFFKAQSNQLEQELKSAARTVADFKKKYGIYDFSALKGFTVGKYNNLVASRKTNEASVRLTHTKIDRLKADLAKLSEHRYTGQSENPEGGLVNMLKGKLIALELRKLDLQQKYKPDFRFQEVEEEMEKVREMLAAEEEEFHGSINTGLNAPYFRLEDQILAQEARLGQLDAERKEIDKQIVIYGQELERLGRLEPELQALERDVKLNELNFRLYITKFEESRVSDAMDAAKMVSVTVLEAATPPRGPIPKNGNMKIFLSLCIAGVAGLGLAFLLEYLDHTFKVPEDIEDKLNVPLLVTIGDLPTKEVLDLEALAVSPAPPIHYQILKTNVAMHAGEKGMKTLSVCSPTRKEGCSTVALNLAAWLAKESSSRLVLVDANLRNPSVHSNCKLPASPGFSEVIHEGASIRDAIQQSVIPNLSVLTSGVSPPNPTIVFESPKLAELVESLKNDFDWVLFDCAPVDLYPDTTLLARGLDGTLLVIQSENKGAEVAIRVKGRLELAGATIVGAVLNRRRQIIPEKIYKKLLL